MNPGLFLVQSGIVRKLEILTLVLVSVIGVSCANAPDAVEPTLTETNIPVVSATARPTAMPSSTPTQTSMPTLTMTLTPTLPAVFIIENMTARKQALPLDCEAAAAVDWARFFGVEINEYEFQHNLPISDNPDKGFVGWSTGPWGQVPPYAYGVHAGPVAEVLQDYGLNAVAVKGMTLDQVKAELAAGRPIIAWVIGNCVGGVPFDYVDEEGDTVTVAAYEHVILLYGYEGDQIYYFNAGKRYQIPADVFMNSFGVLGNMAIVQGVP